MLYSFDEEEVAFDDDQVFDDLVDEVSDDEVLLDHDKKRHNKYLYIYSYIHEH